eukprot:7093746-Lingulodinium_polyedra.AAC.1
MASTAPAGVVFLETALDRGATVAVWRLLSAAGERLLDVGRTARHRRALLRFARRAQQLQRQPRAR